MPNIFVDEKLKDPYQRLAHAIVLRAVEDYRETQKMLHKNPDDRDALIMERDCIMFFQSQWFYFLSGLDGEAVLSRLDKEVIE